MDYDKLIERLWDAGWTNPGLTDKQSLEWDAATAIETLLAENSTLRKMQPVELSGDAATSFALAQEVSRLRAELESEHAHRIHAEQHADDFLRDCEQLNAELERVTAERDGAVRDLELFATCDTCKFGEMKMAYDCLGCDHASNWKWRGVKKED